MKPSSKKPRGTPKTRTKRTPSQRSENPTKLLVVALVARMPKTGPKRPSTTRPTATPVARIKGNAVPGGSGAAYCAVLGDMADQAVDDMEDAIKKNDDEALQKAINDFNAATDHGHSHGCYFSYV